ncbi:Mitochondrial phosphate carrier protein 3 protein, partial [Thalictrum thalictroides]
MAISENTRQSLLPNYLYLSSAYSKTLDLDSFQRRNPSLPSSSPSSNGTVSSKSFLIQAPSEPGKIEMYSPSFYAACTAGGILSCGLTHMTVTPLDLVKCNMQ